MILHATNMGGALVSRTSALRVRIWLANVKLGRLLTSYPWEVRRAFRERLSAQFANNAVEAIDVHMQHDPRIQLH